MIIYRYYCLYAINHLSLFYTLLKTNYRLTNKPFLMTKLILFACASLMILSCTKPASVNPYQTTIVSTWKATQLADDVNNNKIMDAAELKAFTTGETLSLTFKADGTGSRHTTTATYDTTYTFTYTITGNYVNMVFASEGVNLKMYIDKMDSTTGMMTLRSEDNIWAWTVFQKQ